MAGFNLDENNSLYQIRAYQPGKIQVNDKIFERSIIIAPNRLMENWPPQTIEELTAESFLPILELKPAILLIGTGSKLQFISPALYGELINAGIGVEVMTTHSACSTFNALSAENRLVIAALLLA